MNNKMNSPDKLMVKKTTNNFIKCHTSVKIMSTIIIQAFQTIKLFFLNKHVLFQARRCLIFTNKCIRETLFMCWSQVRSLLFSVFPSFCLLYTITSIIFVFVFIIRKVVGFLLFCHGGAFS